MQPHPAIQRVPLDHAAMPRKRLPGSEQSKNARSTASKFYSIVTSFVRAQLQPATSQGGPSSPRGVAGGGRRLERRLRVVFLQIFQSLLISLAGLRVGGAFRFFLGRTEWGQAGSEKKCQGQGGEDRTHRNLRSHRVRRLSRMWCRNITGDVLLCISNLQVRYRSWQRRGGSPEKFAPVL